MRTLIQNQLNYFNLDQEKIKSLKKWGLLFLLSGIVALLFELKNSKAMEPQATDSQSAVSPDTYLPEGFVLIPLQIANFEALDGLLGSNGVVDLFTVNESTNGASRRVASHIKIIRAPQNPGQFAAVAAEEQADLIVKAGGPFFAVVQNPNQTGTKFEQANSRERAPVAKNRSRIFTESSNDE